MIAMLMSDQDSVERVRVFAYRPHPLEGFLAAEPGVDQYARAVGSDKRAVASAGGSENRDFEQPTIVWEQRRAE